MKPTMMFAIILLTAIIIMVSFDISLGPATTATVSATVAPNALYVCPAASNTWDMLAQGFGMFKRPIIIGFSFGLIILLATWAWALYQNLLKDKFVRDAFKTPWSFTKMMFWAVVLISMLIMTPNYFRSVQVVGARGEWVLCESNTPGARAVRADAVQPMKH